MTCEAAAAVLSLCLENSIQNSANLFVASRTEKNKIKHVSTRCLLELKSKNVDRVGLPQSLVSVRATVSQVDEIIKLGGFCEFVRVVCNTSTRCANVTSSFFKAHLGPTHNALFVFIIRRVAVKRRVITPWCGQCDENLGGELHTEHEDTTR